MNIATFTCHYVYNHGAMLQEWALATFLRQLGHEVKIIDYRRGFVGNFKHGVHNKRYDKPLLRWAYLLAKYPDWIRTKKRLKNFDIFYEKYIAPHTTNLFTSLDQLKGNPPKADVYIAGSDQIWNTTFDNGNDPAFYLDFGPLSTRRLSYAASFATEEIVPPSVDFVESMLKNFDAISVRETSGLKILKNLGYEGIQVCDPVFLLNRTDWDKMVDTVSPLSKPYILVYDFENSPEIKAVAKRYAKQCDVKIVSIGPSPLRYADSNFYSAGPDVFVSLIRNAKCVISNSFHGSAFAMIFNRNFFVVNRKDGLNKRMSDLLDHYNMSERLISPSISDEHLIADIDYSRISPLLENDIQSSKEWLISNLK